jgi:hypothetical protein
MSSSHRESGPVEFGVEGHTVLPAPPDDAQPGASKDADGVWVPASSGDGTCADVSCPGVSYAAAIREIHDGGPEFLIAGPAEHGPLVLARLTGRGTRTSEAGKGTVGREALPAVTDLGQETGVGGQVLMSSRVHADVSVGAGR